MADRQGRLVPWVVRALSGAALVAVGAVAGYSVGTGGHDDVYKYCLVIADTASDRGLQGGELVLDGGSGCVPGEAAYCWSFDDRNPRPC